MPAKRKRGSIKFAIRQAIWAMPCAVCGSPYNINVDHIKPVAKGGDSDPLNLQPLCHTCNHIKGCRLTNDQIATVIAARGLRHFLRSVYEERTRFFNPYDRPELDAWMRANPSDAGLAIELYAAFNGANRNA